MIKSTSAIFQSGNDEWGTPQHVFDALDDEFHFDLDPCASAINHKCNHYITIEQDGLKYDWGGTEYSAIPHTAKYLNGLKRHITKAGSLTRLSLCLFRREQIPDGFTAISTEKLKYDLSKAD